MKPSKALLPNLEKFVRNRGHQGFKSQQNIHSRHRREESGGTGENIRERGDTMMDELKARDLFSSGTGEASGIVDIS